ncbi:MAG: site-specific integrase [Clostridia bacterium]|nr:site-specific integrase [Clostridia bacterium]
MSVHKDKKTNTWRVCYRYTDWQGIVRQTTKRGFSTKREALAWEREQKGKNESDLTMTFESFIEIYTTDMKNRVKENTWHTKEHIMRTKFIPYLGKRKMNEIKAKDIIAWQNVMMNSTDKRGKPYSPVYLKTLHNQLSAIFNHAVRYYGLKENPAAKAGNMGKEKSREMLFWTQEEYKKFSEAIMDKPISYYAFEMLYWCGIREGELLALTPADFDFERNLLRINKSFQHLGGRDIITEPKTVKSNRTIKMPEFLCEEMKDYFSMIYGLKENDRIFTITKNYLHHEMDRGSKSAGVKRIRIHDLRHSHISLLIEMGYSAVAIADRVGHESINITYNYAHLFPSTQNDMADKLDQFRKGEKTNVSKKCG